jgi:hypothetical protein
MKTLSRFKVISLVLIAAYLLAACGGTLSQSTNWSDDRSVDSNVVAFTGIVESMDGTQWTIGGQSVILNGQAALDPDIRLGDEVRVEANVSADGTVTVVKVESSAKDAPVSASSADLSSTPEPVATASPDASSTPGVGSLPEPALAQSSGIRENEVFGRVEAITAETITVNGVTYNLSDLAEIKETLQAGDQVKLHVIVNADGTFTVREVQKSTLSVDDNANSNGSDDGPGHDSHDDNSNDDSEEHDDDVGENSNSSSGDD